MGGAALTRWAVLRGLGFIYLVAFVSLVAQLRPLIGAEGLLPAAAFLDRLDGEPGMPWRLPTLFWLGASDGALLAGAWIGLGLAALATLGVSHGAVFGALWALYLSFVHVGQSWYGFGWEYLLLEAGFLATWLAPWRSADALDARSPTPGAILWLLRWLQLRLMLGAGLIKLRGDPCWRELTCLDTHFETQPLPNPLSPLFHALPGPALAGMVGVNHVVELVLPWLCLGPAPARAVAGVGIGVFQLTLILSGNLSFFNWLTLVLCLPLLPPAWLRRVAPARVRARADALPEAPDPAGEDPGLVPTLRRGVVGAVTLLILTLSVQPTLNLLSPDQRMNASFDPLRLVNTYGAFGSVGAERFELQIEGSDDGARWSHYALPFQPGDPARPPPVIAPFQPRLDWAMWFAAQQPPSAHLWLVRLLDQLLRGEGRGPDLLSDNPFPDRPPAQVRVTRWRYRFARGDEPGWWVRSPEGLYIRPLTRDDPLLVALRAEQGW